MKLFFPWLYCIRYLLNVFNDEWLEGLHLVSRSPISNLTPMQNENFSILNLEFAIRPDFTMSPVSSKLTSQTFFKFK